MNPVLYCIDLPVCSLFYTCTDKLDAIYYIDLPVNVLYYIYKPLGALYYIDLPVNVLYYIDLPVDAF